MTYLLDSNAFIQAKDKFYRFSFCPGFWDWLSDGYHRSLLSSIQMVEVELKTRQDELTDWVASTAPQGFFVAPSPEVVTTQSVVTRWVHAQATYTPTEKARFLSKADSWLIAEAIENQREIITFEEMVPANSTKVKIPNVAANFGVKCASLFDVLEASGVTMHL